jgi:hypothetical protein
MDSKFYFLATLCLIGGLVCGYFIATTTFQNQYVAYEYKIQNQEEELNAKDVQLQARDAMIQSQTTIIQSQTTIIQNQEELLQQLKANITKLQIQIEQLRGQQAQTQVRIDAVTWDSALFTLDVRNTGSANAVIETVFIRVNQAGSAPVTYEVQSIRSYIPVASHAMLTFSYQWAASTSYVIRVTTTTGFYYEAVFTSPSS